MEQLGPDRLGEVGLGVVEERRHVVLEGSPPASLVVDEPGLSVPQHDVARLEIPVEEVVRTGFQEKVDESLEVPLQGRLAEGHVSQLEEVVLEVVEVPKDGLAVEGFPGIRHRVVHHRVPFHLEPGQHLHHLPVRLEHLGRKSAASGLPGPIESREQGRIAQVLEEPHAGFRVRSEDLGHVEADAPKSQRIGPEGPVLFGLGTHGADDRLAVRSFEAVVRSGRPVGREPTHVGGLGAEDVLIEAEYAGVHGGSKLVGRGFR